jgi:translocator protein
MVDYKKLILSIIVCQLAGIFGSIFTTSSITTWYNFLNKPSFAPPGSVIGAIWIILYTLMGISLYLVWMSKSKVKNDALTLFFGQLILNALWSLIFFGIRSLSFAFVEIILMWFMILFTIVFFHKISKNSAYLLIPYIAWVTIAGTLNYLILILN